MSRTYRLRHLAKVPVKKQYVRTHCETLYEKRVWVEPDWFCKKYFNAKPRLEVEREYVTWKELSVEEYHIQKYTDGCNHRKEVVANASWHPWISWWTRVNKAGIKRWYRTTGNRAYRHRVGQILKDERMWEEILPLRAKYVDWWDLY